MTTNLQGDPLGVQRESGQLIYAAEKSVSNTVRSGINLPGNLIANRTISISLNSFPGTWTLSIPYFLIGLLIAAIMNTGCNEQSNDLTYSAQNEERNRLLSEEEGGATYLQTNLVSDTAGFNAARIDPTLANAWGLTINPSGILWINANGTNDSEVWDSSSVPKRPPVSVPVPSGIVFNTTTDFIISATNTVSRFIFASENGKIYAWASGDSARTVVNRSSLNAVYKGLELANDGTANYLFATDFHNGKIDVFDKAFNLVTTKPFIDTRIPSGFAPFNIRLLNGVFYVTYAKQLPPDNRDDQKGPGNGYIDIFKTDGSLLKRFASRGRLNSPWGIEIAPKEFGAGDNAILVGNFGDGRINVFDREEGEFQRSLKSNGKPLSIDGLWAITFADNRIPGGNPEKLFFTAGPDDESHGLFGYLLKK